MAAAGAEVLMRRALALFLLVLPLAACGGTNALRTVDPLARASEKTANAAGAHLALNARITALGQTIAVSGSGEIGDNGRKAHMRLSPPMSSAPLEAVAADGALYLRGGPISSVAQGKWVRVKADDSSFNLGTADPAKLLEYLRSTSKVEKRGTATVRGVRTTHYVARIQPKQLKKAVPVDVWVDENGLVRRLSVHLQQVNASLDLFDFGDVNIDVPADSETVDLSNMFGGG
jgi:outer membrane lipoprotein-sorting protein